MKVAPTPPVARLRHRAQASLAYGDAGEQAPSVRRRLPPFIDGGRGRRTLELGWSANRCAIFSLRGRFATAADAAARASAD